MQIAISTGIGNTNAARAPYGPELLVNGDFNSATGWNLGAGWAISGGLLTRTAGAVTACSRPITVVAGTTYRVEHQFFGRTAGTVYMGFLGGTNRFGALRGADGTYVETLVAATGNASFYIAPNDTWDGSFTYISVREVL